MIDTHVLAYLAGVVDSDGSIGVKRSTYAMRVRGDAGQPIYSETIHIKQVEPHAVDLAKSVFGGHLFLERSSLTKGKPLWSWTIHSAAAGRALAELLPYLRIKKRQAENCLALRALIQEGRVRRWPVPVIDPDEELIPATEFAHRVGASPATIHQAAQGGSVPSLRRGRSRLIPVSFLPIYAARLGRTGGRPRSADVTTRMQALYENAKALNRVGVA